MLTILYFARLHDQLGQDKETLELPANISNVGQLRDLLCERGEQWQQALTAKGIFIAVNQEVVNEDMPLSGDEEVAFFPPVTGG
jgi:molybdopterin synthase sulfur carrier subunit